MDRSAHSFVVDMTKLGRGRGRGNCHSRQTGNCETKIQIKKHFRTHTENSTPNDAFTRSNRANKEIVVKPLQRIEGKFKIYN